jgi:hypothetical protein
MNGNRVRDSWLFPGILAALILLPGIASAVVPHLIGYQGQLTNGGTPVNGSVSMTFRLSQR